MLSAVVVAVTVRQGSVGLWRCTETVGLHTFVQKSAIASHAGCAARADPGKLTALGARRKPAFPFDSISGVLILQHPTC